MTSTRSLRVRLAALLVVAAGWLVPRDAPAFVHIVRPGESLAAIATRFYGDATRELLLADANSLDAQGGSAIVPGMRLEVPACSFHRVVEHETWSSIARDWLGDARRADTLARENGAVAWVAPSVGQEVRIPFVLTHIAAEGDTTLALARRYLGDPNRGWELDAFNFRKEWKLVRGDVVLVPIADLDLTEAGMAEAEQARARDRTAHGGDVLTMQKKVSAELPGLLAELRAGKYVEVVAHGSRLLGAGELTRAQLATIHRTLLEAFVALDARPAATAECAEWRKVEPHKVLDPVLVSPKNPLGLRRVTLTSSPAPRLLGSLRGPAAAYRHGGRTCDARTS